MMTFTEFSDLEREPAAAAHVGCGGETEFSPNRRYAWRTRL
jgi:hypothetical protein